LTPEWDSARNLAAERDAAILNSQNLAAERDAAMLNSQNLAAERDAALKTLITKDNEIASYKIAITEGLQYYV
jgi:hypothetical protein